MKLLKHPGRPSQPRRLAAAGRSAGEWRVTLAPGSELLTGLAEALVARGVAQAAVQLLGGGFEAFQYLTGGPDASGARVATYGPPRRLEGPVALIGGNGILGRDAEGRPLLHCHAVVVDSEGKVHGGHLPPGTCRVGAEGLVAQVVALAGAGFAASYDAETNFTLFQPVEGAA